VNGVRYDHERSDDPTGPDTEPRALPESLMRHFMKGASQTKPAVGSARHPQRVDPPRAVWAVDHDPDVRQQCQKRKQQKPRPQPILLKSLPFILPEFGHRTHRLPWSFLDGSTRSPEAEWAGSEIQPEGRSHSVIFVAVLDPQKAGYYTHTVQRGKL